MNKAEPLSAQAVEASRAGNYKSGTTLAKEALEARREVLGPRHPDTVSSLNNLASLYSAQGRYGEAEPLLRKVLQARREVLGARHPEVERIFFIIKQQTEY